MPIQIREFAEQVLYGNTLEEKLAFPREEIVDTQPGAALVGAVELNRPAHLKLRTEDARSNSPSNAKLIDERERGRLLHFFCNHELLATELMALALLRFPDAPASFRQGLLETLKEEQIHTQLYLHRMKQCGVEFGELPLSDYFWRSVSTMEDPLDYVTRLSLTFEQANLDYAREYGAIFETVGDSATAGILDRIYRDEIGHVGFGLRWFRQWKARGKSDWEAFKERLVFPMSPARAKGNQFNAEGRSEAGLDESFISDLRLFSQSRGRTPRVYWFNPNAERYAAQNTAQPLTTAASNLGDDLSFLPAYLAKKDDVLIVSESPSKAFLQRIQKCGFTIPEIIAANTQSGQPKAPDIKRKLNGLRPWAWTPDSISFFEKLLPKVTHSFDAKSLWTEFARSLFSKETSAAWARQITPDPPVDDWMAPRAIYGRPVRDYQELTAARNAFNELGYADLAIKAPFGSAANGNRILRAEEALSSRLKKWIETLWDTQQSVIVEPWLDRVFDFSVQFEYSAKIAKVIGFTQIANNARGQIHGVITNGFCKGASNEITRFLFESIRGRPRAYTWYENTLAPQIAAQLAQSNYNGPFGVDAFVYRDPDNQLRLKPIVELNPRYTMGRVGLELGKRNAPSSMGFLQILSRSQIKKNGVQRFSEYAAKLETEHPVVLTSEAKPKIVSGSLPLVDPTLAQDFLAVYHVRERFADLPI